ncbi:hypothetical protein GCM10029964_108370 [Kibdelosporangium lantanae]
MFSDPGVYVRRSYPHTGGVTCAVRRPFPLPLWVALPVLFTAAVVGLTSLAAVLVNGPADVVLTSAHLGAAAAVTGVAGLSVEWRPRLRAARWAYPLAVFVLGLVVHGTDVPTTLALAIGLPSVAVLATGREYFCQF